MYRDRCNILCTRALRPSPWVRGGIQTHITDGSWQPGRTTRRSAGGPMLDEVAWRRAVENAHSMSSASRQWDDEWDGEYVEEYDEEGDGSDPRQSRATEAVVGAVRVGGGFELRTASGGVMSAASRRRRRVTQQQTRSVKTSAKTVARTWRAGTPPDGCLEAMKGQGYLCCRHPEVPALVQVDSALRNLRMQQFVEDFPAQTDAVASTAAARARALRRTAARPPPPHPKPTSPSPYLFRETLPRVGVPEAAAPPQSRPAAAPQPPSATALRPARHGGAAPPPPPPHSGGDVDSAMGEAARHASAATAAAISSAEAAAKSAAATVAGVDSPQRWLTSVPWPTVGKPLLPAHDPLLCLQLCDAFTQELRHTQARIATQLETMRAAGQCTCA